MLRRVIADVLFARGHPRLAARLAPTNAHYHVAAAQAAHRAGNIDAAVRHAERAVELDQTLEPAHLLLERLFLHGENYLDVLARIHRHVRPRTYVEIGVQFGYSLALVLPHTRVVGIDPDPKLEGPAPPNAKIYRETSDDFFAKYDLRAELGGLPVDLAFIDGMHRFEFALRDFMNLERAATPQSTIMFDDCFPHDRQTAQREQHTVFWSGDVWKTLVLLKKYRPQLRIHTIAAPRTGLCIVRNLDPGSRFIADNLERLVEEFMALDYSYLEKDRAKKLNLFPNDWQKIQPLLG
jgi:predicted O-methyltransferase YrrM